MPELDLCILTKSNKKRSLRNQSEERFYLLQFTNRLLHGLRTPNEGINQRYVSEKLGKCGRQNILWPYLKIWELESICGRAISSLGIRSPWFSPLNIFAAKIQFIRKKLKYCGNYYLLQFPIPKKK